jgi:hypothetical protein
MIIMSLPLGGTVALAGRALLPRLLLVTFFGDIAS